MISKLGSKDATYQELIESFPENECCYAFYNCVFKTPGGVRSKLVSYLWCPETASGKDKMIYAASKYTITQCLQGVQVRVEGTDVSEFDEELVLKRCLEITH